MRRVVKLGGSLLETTALSACLEAVERYPGQTLLVPGGGVLAEQVRTLQMAYRFDEVTAHRMALLAMQQMALLFNGVKPAFKLFDTPAAVSDSAKVSIWSPQITELDSAGIAASWAITSDSLAAWLAGQVRAGQLILVKAAPVDSRLSLSALQAQGIVDAAFTDFAAALRCDITVINKDQFISML